MVSVSQTDLTTYSAIDDAFGITIKRNGLAQNITGWIIYFTVKKNRGDSENIFSKTIINHTAPLEGKTIITINKEDLKGLWGDFYYDIKVDNDLGKREIYSDGKLIIKPGVKR